MNLSKNPQSFCHENFILSMSINRGQIGYNSKYPCKICVKLSSLFSLSLSLSLSVKGIEEEIQSFCHHVNTARGWTIEKISELNQ